MNTDQNDPVVIAWEALAEKRRQHEQEFAKSGSSAAFVVPVSARTKTLRLALGLRD